MCKHYLDEDVSIVLFVFIITTFVRDLGSPWGVGTRTENPSPYWEPGGETLQSNRKIIDRTREVLGVERVTIDQLKLKLAHFGYLPFFSMDTKDKRKRCSLMSDRIFLIEFLISSLCRLFRPGWQWDMFTLFTMLWVMTTHFNSLGTPPRTRDVFLARDLVPISSNEFADSIRRSNLGPIHVFGMWQRALG